MKMLFSRQAISTAGAGAGAGAIVASIGALLASGYDGARHSGGVYGSCSRFTDHGLNGICGMSNSQSSAPGCSLVDSVP